MTITYEDAVKELYYSLYATNPTNFHAVLYRLIGKADGQNKARLRLAYPLEVKAFDDWQASENPADFFRQYGF